MRNGKNWDKTLLVVTYDDYGGFYDHVVPPAAPNDESPCNVWNVEHNVSKDGKSCHDKGHGRGHGMRLE